MKCLNILIAVCAIYSGVESIEIKCRLDQPRGICVVDKLNITSQFNRTITRKFTQQGFDDNAVLTFRANNQTVKWFPLDLAVHFPNIKSVEITNSSLSNLTSGDLRQFGDKLANISLSANSIKILGQTLFIHNPNLQAINFTQNLIKRVVNGSFAKLTKLQNLQFVNNRCFSGASSTVDDTKILINDIYKKCSGASMPSATALSVLFAAWILSFFKNLIF